jgi:hypothetical protein
MAKSPSQAKAVKAFLPDAISKSCARFEHLSIASAFSDLLARLVPLSADVRDVVFDRYFADILIPVSRASFCTLAATIPDALRAFHPDSSERKRLARYCDSMVSQPSFFRVFRLYCNGVRERLRRDSPPSHKAEFVVRIATDFFGPARPVDAFRAEEYLAEWTALLRDFVPLERALPLMAAAYGRLGRPLLALAEIAKVARDLRARPGGPQAVAAALAGADFDREALARIERGDAVADIVRALVRL